MSNFSTVVDKMGVVMKLALIFTLSLITQLTFAQSLREKKIKQQMLERVELLLEKVKSSREDLAKQDAAAACGKIKEIFLIYPDHLKALGGHLDLYRGRVVRAKNEALHDLIFLHKQTLYCDQGKDAEYIDPKKLNKEMKEIEKALIKHRRVIKRADTSYENSFYYEYEF